MNEAKVKNYKLYIYVGNRCEKGNILASQVFLLMVGFTRPLSAEAVKIRGGRQSKIIHIIFPQNVSVETILF